MPLGMVFETFHELHLQTLNYICDYDWRGGRIILTPSKRAPIWSRYFEESSYIVHNLPSERYIVVFFSNIIQWIFIAYFVSLI